MTEMTPAMTKAPSVRTGLLPKKEFKEREKKKRGGKGIFYIETEVRHSRAHAVFSLLPQSGAAVFGYSLTALLGYHAGLGKCWTFCERLMNVL